MLPSLLVMVWDTPRVALAQARPRTAPTQAAERAGRPLAIEDFYRLRSPGAPALSPDGRWVAFTVTSREEATNRDPVRSVARAKRRALGGDARLSRGGECRTTSTWSADGRLRLCG